MKFLKKRPLSVNLSLGNPSSSNFIDTNDCDDFKALTLSYINPTKINNRRSVISTNRDYDYLPNSFGINNSEADSNSSNATKNSNYMTPEKLQSFRNYNNDFNSCSISKATNKSLSRSYITPISQNWSPVKDVLKIKRSTSVPFRRHSNQTGVPTKVANSDPTNDISKDLSKESRVNDFEDSENTKKKKELTSIGTKIRIFLRNRSLSKSAKLRDRKDISNPMTKIANTDKNQVRRYSTLESSAHDKIQSHFTDRTFVNHLDGILKQKAKENMSKNLKFSQPPLMSTSISNFNHNNFNITSPRKQFSTSVVAHTASSAAKCRPPSSLQSSVPPVNGGITFRQSRKSNLMNNNVRNNNNINNNNNNRKNNNNDKNSNNNNNNNKVLLRKNKCDVSDSARKSRKNVKFSEQAENNKDNFKININNNNDNINNNCKDDNNAAVLTNYISNDNWSSCDKTDNLAPRHPNSIQSSIKHHLSSPSQKQRPQSCLYNGAGHTNFILPKSPYLSQYSKLYSLRVSQNDLMPDNQAIQHPACSSNYNFQETPVTMHGESSIDSVKEINSSAVNTSLIISLNDYDDFN